MFKVLNKITKSSSLDKWFLLQQELKVARKEMWILIQHFCFLSGRYAFGKPSRTHPSAGTHTSSFLLKLCGFLSVGYGPLHKAHRLVHVAFDPIDHSTLTACIASGAAESHIKEYIKTEKERAAEREAGSSAVRTAWFLKGSVRCVSIKWFNRQNCQKKKKGGCSCEKVRK